MAEVQDGRIVLGPKRRPIWERIAEMVADVPPEELAKLPADGASQHDHSVHGNRNGRIFTAPRSGRSSRLCPGSVFADTFYWIALIDPRDAFHAAAHAYSGSLGPVRLVTTDEVFDES